MSTPKGAEVVNFIDPAVQLLAWFLLPKEDKKDELPVEKSEFSK